MYRREREGGLKGSEGKSPELFRAKKGKEFGILMVLGHFLAFFLRVEGHKLHFEENTVSVCTFDKIRSRRCHGGKHPRWTTGTPRMQEPVIFYKDRLVEEHAHRKDNR